MGGSGGGSVYYNVRQESLQQRVREASEEISKDFLPRLQELLDEKLSIYNRRDTDLIQRRLNDITEKLGGFLEGKWDFRFGGSVAKHTYVDGLSDVDSLLIVGGEFDTTQPPKSVLDAIVRRLSGMNSIAGATSGHIAVTVRYQDGMEIQLVPAVREGTMLRVPSWTRDGWSRINPKKFTDALTRRNGQCEGKLVPTIKLAKGIIATWPGTVRLSGYHVESLAIDSFRNYGGPKNTAAMLPYFFEQAAAAVLKPIRDRTGQSIHVDGYLGKANSEEREKAAHWCQQVAKRMRNASVQGSFSQWMELFDE